MRTSFASLLVPFAVSLAALALVGCGGDGSSSSTAGGGGGSGGAGGGGSNTTGAGMTTTGNGMTTTTGIGMGGPPVPTDAPVYNLLPGAETLVGPDYQASFGITALDSSNYRIIWSGGTGSDGAPVAFEGSIWTKGTFKSITPGCDDQSCEFEEGDEIVPQSIVDGGQYFGFKAKATTDLDGIDFSVDQEPVYFELLHEGFPTTTRVLFPKTENGGGMSQPEQIPFALQTKE